METAFHIRGSLKVRCAKTIAIGVKTQLIISRSGNELRRSWLVRMFSVERVQLP